MERLGADGLLLPRPFGTVCSSASSAPSSPLTVLASALLAAGGWGKLPLRAGLLALAAGCVVFFALSTSDYPPLRVGMLVAGMCLCLYY